jgi:DNA helicase-2/ATP-dependent DNA helicase PcrA
LPSADIESAIKEIEDVIGLDGTNAPKISAKQGLNIESVLEKTGYLTELQQSKSAQDQSRLDNLSALVERAENFADNEEDDNLETYLANVALVSDIDSSEFGDGAITMMTLHSAKGLEFPVVFLVGMEEGIFPHARTIIDDGEIEEERRLCYVGLTRAERRLFLSHAQTRMVFGNHVCYPRSRFIDEIPEEYIKEYQRPQVQRSVVQQTIVQRKDRPTNTNWFLGGKSSFIPKESSGNKGTKFAVGDKVNHKIFGDGTIVAVADEGDYQAVTIAFPGNGIKMLSTKYVALKKI